VLEQTGLLPADFFMQAEEYDLSFRIWAAGFSVQRFWDMPLRDLLPLLQATPAGLTSAEAKERLRLYGPNALVAESRFAALIGFLGFFANPLVLVLLAASAISMALGDPIGGGIIIAIVLLSVIGCGVFLWVQDSAKNKAGQTMGHVWDETLEEYDNPLPNWWRWTICGGIVAPKMASSSSSTVEPSRREAARESRCGPL